MEHGELDRCWANFLEAEKGHIKAARISALESLVDAFDRQPERTRSSWALGLARQIVDDEAAFPVRFPLVRRILLPALIDGFLAKQPGCARWLAHFVGLPDHFEKETARLPETLRTRDALLREALRVDPSDALARRALIHYLMNYLSYTIHEVPTGVLFGADGATSDQCGELLDLLSEFRMHLSKAGRTREYTDLIKDCAYHYEAYRTYLRFGYPSRSYKSYLEANPGPT